MARYTKKPVTIEAVQFLGCSVNGGYPIFKGDEGAEGLPAWILNAMNKDPHEDGSIKANVNGTLFVMTLEGVHTANKGDWIIRGVKGELYPCKPDIFDLTYTPAED